MKPNVMRNILPALALAGIVSSPAFAQSVSGSGVALDVQAGSESITIFKNVSDGHAVLHLRNVGSRTVKLSLTLQCDGDRACGLPRTFSVEPVASERDGSRDQTLSLPDSTRTFTWTIAS
jgi:hypothetical protein